MFVKDLLMGGDFVVPVPVGLPVTIQYGPEGHLEKVNIGYDKDSMYDITSDVLLTWRDNNTSPIQINLKGGTTWVYGILHTTESYDGCGSLPECISEKLLQGYLSTPRFFEFYAGHAESLATVFGGANAEMFWMRGAGFSVLDGVLAPANCTETSIKSILSRVYKFPISSICYYIIYRESECFISSTEMSQFRIKTIEVGPNTSGFVRGVATMCDDFGNEFETTYSLGEVVTLDLHVGSTVMFDAQSKIVLPESVKPALRNIQYTCTHCGKLLTLPESMQEDAVCDDPHCTSRQYESVNSFLSTLELEPLSFESYNKYVKANKLTFVADALDLKEYKNNEMIISISKAVRAVIPYLVISDNSVISRFCNRCNNNLTTVQYYLKHPSKIITDLKMEGLQVSKLVSWLEDGRTLMELEQLVNNSKVSIQDSNSKFEGAPILYGKTVYITGTFVHGSLNDVESILNSYSGTVVRTYSDDVDVVIYGDIPQEMNSGSVRKAQQAHKSVMRESEFFDKLGIDADLVENLV